MNPAHAKHRRPASELSRSVERLSMLLDLSHALHSEWDLDRLLDMIVARTTQILGAERTTLYLVDEANDQLWSRVAQGPGITELRLPRGAGIAGYVATSGEIVNITNAYEDPRFDPEVDRRTGYRTHTILCAPVSDPNGRTIGVLQVMNNESGIFTAEDEHLLSILARQVGVALTNAKSMEAGREEVRRSNFLLDVMRSLSSELELDKLLERITTKTAEILQADRCSISLVDQRTKELWFRVTRDVELREVRLPSGVGIAGYVAATGETLNIPDAYADPRFNREADTRTGYRTKTILSVPMRNANGTIIGVLQVLNKDDGLFTKDDEDLLHAIASQAVIALQNAKLFEEVVEMKNYNESVLHSMATGVITVDMQGRTTTANPAAERILGLADGVPANARFDAVVDERRNRSVCELVASALKSGEPHRVEKLHYSTSSGDVVTVNLSTVPLLDHKLARTGLVMVIEDVSREQQLLGTLSRVISRQVAEQLVASGRLPRVGGERKEVTVVMSDIRNFTAMTESADPEEIVGMLNAYFARMIDVIFGYRGSLDKFIGDAIMAVFGSPIAHPDDPLRAVFTAIDMRRVLRQFNREREVRGEAAIEIGIGICLGEVVSGAIGSEERMEFTVIGDPVNTASRFESLTKSFPRHKILLSHSVYERVQHRVACDFLGEEMVRGKSHPLRVYGISEDSIFAERGHDPTGGAVERVP